MDDTTKEQINAMLFKINRLNRNLGSSYYFTGTENNQYVFIVGTPYESINITDDDLTSRELYHQVKMYLAGMEVMHY